MNEIQKKIQTMILELFQALKKNSISNPLGGYDDALEIMDGIHDGSFFELPHDVQCQKLGWLKVSFFGRGERAIPLFIAGLLPEDFDTKYRDLYRQYRDSWEVQ